MKLFVRVEWRAQGDNYRTFLTEFVSSMPQAELPIGRLAALDVW